MDQTAALAANQANWDERVAAHLIAYRVEDFIADASQITAVVRDDLALMRPQLSKTSVAGLDLLHLQCHIGLDTLSWARLGANVTGIDFSTASTASTAAARDIAARAGLSATFLDSDVDHALDAGAGRFDVVYTGIGALPWLPDLAGWARVVAGLLRPGGLLYVRDSNPVLNAVDHDRGDTVLVLTQPYFATGRPLHYDHGTTYADDEVRLQHADTYEWQHSLAEIVQALLNAGLTLTSLGEHRTIPWRALPQMVETDEGYILPDDSDRMPLTFSLTATKHDDPQNLARARAQLRY